MSKPWRLIDESSDESRYFEGEVEFHGEEASLNTSSHRNAMEHLALQHGSTPRVATHPGVPCVAMLNGQVTLENT